VARWTARRTVAAFAVGGVLAGSTILLGMGDAVAVTAADSCGGTVTGKMGETVTLKSSAVQQAAVDAVSGGVHLPLLGIKNNKAKLRELFEAGRFEPISLTTVPHAPAGVFSDEKIAEAVVRTIDADKNGKKILDAKNNRAEVLKAVEAHCSDLTVRASDYVPPKQGGSGEQSQGKENSSGAARPDSSGADSGSSSSSSASEGAGAEPDGALPATGSGTARAPQRDYGQVPYQLPGIGSDKVPDVPDAAPYGSAPGAGDIGILGADGDGPEVSNAGNAEQIHAAEGHDRALQLPMLLAVVSLACVAAALVRTWVLRRV